MAVERPILNPTLRLLMEPAPVAGTGGGKSQRSIVRSRISEQRRTLSRQLGSLADPGTRFAASGHATLIVARMFEDSFAPSHTPNDLFSPDAHCRFIAPLGNGFLIEVDDRAFTTLATRAAQSDRAKDLSDISRVKSVEPFEEQAVLRGRSIDDLWSRGLEDGDGRLFNAWLMPYASEDARELLIRRFEGLAERGQLALPRTDPVADAPRGLAATSVGRALREYRSSQGVGRSILKIRSEVQLANLVGSGTVFRLDPVHGIALATAPSAAPQRMPRPAGHGPVVACIDGGMTDPQYALAEAWRTVPLVSDKDADTVHGNAIASLITHASTLNPNLHLPNLECRVGIAQAVPRPGASGVYRPDDLFDFLSRLGITHRDARVWNMSFNLKDYDDDPNLMSDFGHQISLLARAANVLPVVSIGNSDGSSRSLLPPGDAEAAITVGGRVATRGAPGPHCSICCSGPGPDGMLKPELSWFSPVITGEGHAVRGSSYAAALVSAVAAHTFEQLKEPTPDLVKALLISKAERDEHDPALGWGSPFHAVAPWECEPGSVTMAWNAALEPGFDYYWRDIPVPPEMLSQGKLVGGASLTAILQPLTSPFAGPNYFSTRVEVALQRLDPNGKWPNLLGSMRESTIDEETARSDLKKWNPIRQHRKNRFSVGANAVPVLRVRARLYTRDLFQAGHPGRQALPPQRVAFVLTLKSANGDDGVYSSMVQRLGTFVDSAVIEQTVQIETQ